ncbi:MAG: hypothetical protein QG580_358 [Patescibacteria group bacterium]|jgi:hypothetical protein|nr:hypothetical protein [Patescibacteria group bacterium]
MKVLLTVCDLESMPREKSLFLIGVWLILLAYFIGLPTEIKNYLFIATGLLIIFLSYRSSIKDFSDGRKEYQSHEELVHKPTPKPETFAKEPEKKKVITRKIFKLKPEAVVEKRIEEVAPATKEEDILQKSILELPSYQKIEDNSFKIRRARIRRKPKVMREEVFGSAREEEKVYTPPSTNIYEEEDDVIVISSDGDK